jgi:hypothetical protein
MIATMWQSREGKTVEIKDQPLPGAEGREDQKLKQRIFRAMKLFCLIVGAYCYPFVKTQKSTPPRVTLKPAIDNMLILTIDGLWDFFLTENKFQTSGHLNPTFNSTYVLRKWIFSQKNLHIFSKLLKSA